jgi:hypothetical protein
VPVWPWPEASAIVEPVSDMFHVATVLDAACAAPAEAAVSAAARTAAVPIERRGVAGMAGSW